MPRRARTIQHASYFHVINRSVRKLVLFSQPADYRAFLSILNEALDAYAVRLVAYTVMPTYWHLVVGQTGTTMLSQCLHRVTSTHASHLNRLRKLEDESPVYQGRFAAVEIAAVGDLVRICRLVERSALQAGLVRRSQDWPWASLSERLQPVPSVQLVAAPFLSSRAWADYVNTSRPEDRAEEHALLTVTRLNDFPEMPGRFA